MLSHTSRKSRGRAHRSARRNTTPRVPTNDDSRRCTRRERPAPPPTGFRGGAASICKKDEESPSRIYIRGARGEGRTSIPPHVRRLRRRRSRTATSTAWRDDGAAAGWRRRPKRTSCSSQYPRAHREPRGEAAAQSVASACCMARHRRSRLRRVAAFREGRGKTRAQLGFAHQAPLRRKPAA